MTMVPTAPINIAFLPPMRSVSKPLMICPNAYASNAAPMILPIWSCEYPNWTLMALLAMGRLYRHM